MAGLRLLDRIHGERADGVRHAVVLAAGQEAPADGAADAGAAVGDFGMVMAGPRRG